MPDLLGRAVEAIGAASPDLVAVTGDLIDHPFYGMRDDTRIAQGEKDLHLIREIFGSLTCPVAYVYGNHDRPESFMRIFGDQPVDFDVVGHRILLFFDEEIDCHMAQRLGDQRERLMAALSDHDPKPQIHLQHYLIAPERNEGYPHNYREFCSLRKTLLADRRVRLVLSGHYHKGVQLFQDGAVHFGTVPAFAEPDHPYRIYTLDDQFVREREFTLNQTVSPGRKAVFLDRDGTINPQPSYRTGPKPFQLMAGVGDALARLQNAGFMLVVVSNQTAVGLGLVTVETVGEVNDKMGSLLAPFGVEVDGVYCCYHSRRAVLPQYLSDDPPTKPNPAMLRQAAEDLQIDLSASYMVGDRKSDLGAGRNAGCRASILVRTGDGERTERGLKPGECDHVAASLTDATAWILGKSGE
jgi:D-glycero-D-manno-heptose 1,7-bisphosphate phosphatase